MSKPDFHEVSGGNSAALGSGQPALTTSPDLSEPVQAKGMSVAEWNAFAAGLQPRSEAFLRGERDGPHHVDLGELVLQNNVAFKKAGGRCTELYVVLAGMIAGMIPFSIALSNQCHDFVLREGKSPGMAVAFGSVAVLPGLICMAVNALVLRSVYLGSKEADAYIEQECRRASAELPKISVSSELVHP